MNMLSIEDLTAALNDPASPMREKLLRHLSTSGIDPSAAYQEIMKQDKALQGEGFVPRVPLGGEPPKVDSADGFRAMLEPPMPAQTDLSREANPTGIVNLANSSEVMPNSSLMPTEGSGLDYMKILQGIPGMQPQQQRQMPQAPAVAPQRQSWSPFSARMLESQAVARPDELAAYMAGRR
jgi:hypothetical protein